MNLRKHIKLVISLLFFLVVASINAQDTDGDGVLDTQETTDGTNVNDPCDYNAASQVVANVNAAWTALDCDGDGVTNGLEIVDATDPQDPCSLITPDVTPSASWNAADCDQDGNPNGTDPNLLVPTAVNDAFTAPFGTSTTFDILVNDDFLPGVDTTITDLGTGTAAGTANFDPLTGQLTYTPTAAEALSGVPVMLDYQVCNTVSPTVCDTATITITPTDADTDGDSVPDSQESIDGTDPNDPCSYNAASQNIMNVTAAWNALDCDGDGVTNGTEINNGTDTQDPCSLIVANQDVAPSAAWNAADCDQDGNPNDPDPNPLAPTVVDDSFTIPLGASGMFDILANDDFLPGTDTTITDLGTGTATGTIVFDVLTGEITYTRTSVEAQSVTIDYQVCNTAVNPAVCDSATITINYSDSDGDGVLDFQENIDGTNPNDNCDYILESITIVPSIYCTANIITGNIKLDLDNNGCDVNDIAWANKRVLSDNGNYTIATFTRADGSYTLNTGEGNYNTTVPNISNYYTGIPNIHTSNFVGAGNTDVADFCITPNGTINDVQVAIYRMGSRRPGFNTYYNIQYKNIGTTVLNGDVQFQYDNNKLNFLSASVAQDSQTTNTLNFNYTNLQPFEARYITVYFNIYAPPINQNGDMLNVIATVTPINGDYNTDNNIQSISTTLIGSYDPNDISVLEPEIGIADFDKYLHYQIRFQNTGTADAINIVVTNQLDDRLDWDTLELVDISHDMGRAVIKNGNEIEFIFENIHLPDSTTDEAGSNGYIAYRVKPKNNVTIGEVINNQAKIYFDFNPAIVTNIATTTVTPTASIADNELAKEINLYPNPSTGIVTIAIKNNKITTVEVYSKLGQLVYKKQDNAIQSIDISQLSKGLYFVKFINKKGSNAIKKIILE